MPIAEQSIASTKKSLDLKNGVGSTSKEENSKRQPDGQADVSKDTLRIASDVKRQANRITAAQRIILTKKAEGIQISRSKHWKFISSYHGPFYLFQQR
jgi:hypothetical protein